MNALIVSTYPPMACGIGKYAEQQAAALRGEGHRVDVLCPPEGDGDYCVNVHGGVRPLRLLRFLWAYDEAFIHFAPPFFYDHRSGLNRILTSLALLAVIVLMGARVTFVVHETSFRLGQPQRGLVRHRIDRGYWRRARRVVFHSAAERAAFAEFYRLPADSPRFEIWPQERFVAPRCQLSQAEARAALGFHPDHCLLLCIGFIQPNKGYERAIEAMGRVEGEDVQLRIVGSVRAEGEEAAAYAAQLHEMCTADARCRVIEGFLSDELFDLWLTAADYVVVPYVQIWTSAVAARAKRLGKPLLAAQTGALAEQLTPGSRLFTSDEELAEAIAWAARHKHAGAGAKAGANL